MAKESGIGMSIAVDDSGGSVRTISNDITSFDLSTPRNIQIVTGIDKSAEERLQLLADFTITLNGVFNDASNVAHAVFSTVPSSSVARTVTITVSGTVERYVRVTTTGTFNPVNYAVSFRRGEATDRVSY